jgi:hypothetical protein
MALAKDFVVTTVYTKSIVTLGNNVGQVGN